ENKKFKDIKYLGDELTESEVNQIIGTEMQECWDKFGSGNLDAFFVPRNLIEKVGITSLVKGNSIGCITCSDIIFKLPEKEKFKGLLEYLKEEHKTITQHESGCPEKNTCWYEFAKDNQINLNITFDTSIATEYFVVFVRQNIRKGEGTLNTYVMDQDTKNRVCETTLPFKFFT
ncbi:MAG: hypothetical protein ABIB43_05300, partial [archaeon]